MSCGLPRRPRRYLFGSVSDFSTAGVDAAEDLGLMGELERVHFPIPYLRS